jgi:hypothetical protein
MQARRARKYWLPCTKYNNGILRSYPKDTSKHRQQKSTEYDTTFTGRDTQIPYFSKSVVFLLYNHGMADQPYTKYKRVFAKNSGILRASTAIRLGVPQHILYKMLEDGELVRESSGIYRLTDTGPLGNPDLVQISLRVPRAVICLISALYFHELTTQIPHQVHIALPRDVKTPKIDHPPIKAFHFSEAPYRSGIEGHVLDGVPVKIYSREKTIADCFKFREKLGTNIALEALRDYLSSRRPNVQLVLKYAKVNRVENVMRPYLESLV